MRISDRSRTDFDRAKIILTVDPSAVILNPEPLCNGPVYYSLLYIQGRSVRMCVCVCVWGGGGGVTFRKSFPELYINIIALTFNF